MRLPLDRRPWRRRVRPLLLLVVAGLAACARRGEVVSERPPDVVIYLVDTLRADHVGAYGYDRPTTPVLDAIARTGVVCKAARAQSSWTRPAVATLLTGLDPREHGVLSHPHRLPEVAETLGERLGAAGFATGYFTANINVSERVGFDQGYDAFRYVPIAEAGAERNAAASEVLRPALTWLESVDADRRALLYVHVMEPHEPYIEHPGGSARFGALSGTPSPELRDRIRELRHAGQGEAVAPLLAEMTALYDGEIAAADAALGDFVAGLERLGRWRQTLFLFVSDHGEEFLDHGGFGHGRTLYEEQLRIPMVWKLPGARGGGRTLDTPVDQADVLPTLLEAVGLPMPGELSGRSLWPALVSAAPLAERPSFALLDQGRHRFESVWRSGAKLIRRLDPGGPRPGAALELFELDADPRERRDLARTHPELLAQLAALLDERPRDLAPPLESESPPLDAETEEQLHALGYLR